MSQITLVVVVVVVVGPGTAGEEDAYGSGRALEDRGKTRRRGTIKDSVNAGHAGEEWKASVSTKE